MYIRRDGFYPGVENYLKFVKEGDVVLNIGSHIGLEAMVFGKIIGPEGRLYLFEPYEVSRNILIKNLYINDLDDIATVYPIAASNQKTTAYLMVAFSNTGGSNVETTESLKRKNINEHMFNEKREISVDTVDNVLPKDLKANFAFIDVQWLDVECL